MTATKKKSTNPGRRRPSPSVKPARTKKATTRSRTRSSVTSKRRRVPQSIHEMSTARRARVFMAVRRVMKAHGVGHDIAAIHFTPAATAAPQDCPEGQVRRIHCTTKDDGTVVCESRCEPV